MSHLLDRLEELLELGGTKKEIVLLVIFTLVYLPFMKASEAAQRKQFEMAQE